MSKGLVGVKMPVRHKKTKGLSDLTDFPVKVTSTQYMKSICYDTLCVARAFDRLTDQK